MSDIKFEILDDTNINDVMELEKKLYISFVEKIPNDWVKSKYTFIDNERLKPNRPYEKITVFLFKKNQEIIASIAVHFDMDNILELEDFNFNLKNREKSCEGLFFFVDSHQDINFFDLEKHFYKMIQYLKDRDIQYVYGTCGKKLRSLYKMIGFKVLDKVDYKNDVVYFIKLDTCNILEK